ncbi:hypothetical protein [Nocardiopsis sp. Huas11]|uniref:hypothetical protein n=1 Tax=Nocardiopsis sp. Huas11 TaxID=2183912 RepID=UPI001F20F185|nr:hypothetical protein [Nocardiopsis sp. Huas11]
MPGEEQRHGEPCGLGVLDVGVGGQVRDDVVGRLAAFGGDRGEPVVEERPQALFGAAAVGDVAGGQAPLAEAPAVGVGHPEEFADDLDRQRHGEGLVQVGGARTALHGLDELDGEPFHARGQEPHPLGRDVGPQQGAHPGVVGLLGVEVAHRPAEERGLPRAGGAVRVAVSAAEAIVVEQCADLVVTGDEPGVVADSSADAMDGSLGAQALQLGRSGQRPGPLEGQSRDHGVLHSLTLVCTLCFKQDSM